jgi:signal transduction histidine kinase
MNKIKNSLSNKILNIVAIFFVSITLISYLSITTILKDTLYKLEKDKANLIAQNYAPLMAVNLFLGMKEQIDILTDNIMKNEGVLKVNVYDMTDLIVSQEKQNIINGIKVKNFIFKPNSQEKIGYIELIYSTDHFNKLINKYFMIMLASFLIISLIFVWLNLYIKNLLKPLKKLARILKNYSSKDDIKIPYLDEINEIGLIANAMNISHKKTLEYSQELQSNNRTLEERVKEEIEIIKQKDRQLIQQSRLAQMGEMISMIAHQWRQPLTAISATTNNLNLKLMIGDMDSELFQKELSLIAEYSEHLSNTIDDFRGFFKENKTKETTTLEDVVNGTLDIIRKSIENKNIEIKTQFNCKEKFKTYPNEVKQVILNIMKNAEDALIDNKIKNPYIIIKTICNSKELILKIKDNAGGIPTKVIDKIFDPYFSTKLEKDGTGLGLYMSKTIIQDHCDGKLNVINSNDGAEFTVIFKRIFDD